MDCLTHLPPSSLLPEAPQSKLCPFPKLRFCSPSPHPHPPTRSSGRSLESSGNPSLRLRCQSADLGPCPSPRHAQFETMPSSDDLGSLTALEKPVRTLLIDNYDSYTYNLYQLLYVINGVAPVVVRNDELSWEQLQHVLYDGLGFDNIVISPGPGSPMCPADIGICLQVLQECDSIPILGVCMGHQALGYANGARVVHAPEPVHGRLSELEHIGCALFENIPSGAGNGFKVVRYHSLMLDADTLPEDLIPTAWTVVSESDQSLEGLNSSNPWELQVGFGSADSHADHITWQQSSGPVDSAFASRSEEFGNGSALPKANKGPNNPDKKLYGIGGVCCRKVGQSLDTTASIDEKKNHYCNGSGQTTLQKVIMAISHRTRPHYGVQFHPESVATAFGKQILENFRNLTRVFWQTHSAQRKEKRLSFLGDKKRKKLQNNLLPDSGNVLINDLYTLRDSAKSRPKAAIIGSRSGVLRLHWERVDGIATQAGGSANIFCSLFGDGAAQNTFWLDSSSREHGRARFSFMGGEGGRIWQCISYSLSRDNNGLCRGNGTLKIENHKGCIEEKELEEGFLEFLSNKLKHHVSKSMDHEKLPFDFCGGYIGYLGYELKAECGARPNQHKSQLPDACFFFVDRFVAIDHLNGDVYVLALYDEMAGTLDKSDFEHSKNGSSYECFSHAPNVQPDYTGGGCLSFNCESSVNFKRDTLSFYEDFITTKEAAEAWVQATLRRLSELVESGTNLAVDRKYLSRFASSSSPFVEFDTQFKLLKSRNQYIKDVEKCLVHIRDGESYELCLTTQMQKRMKSPDTLGLYLTLREMNPAPYAAWLNFGREDVCICCSSPERFLRLDQTGTLEAKPIKGTTARGSSPKEDEQLKHELQDSEKNRAENLMIVDLLRNDLGRVCKPGTVHVSSLMAVESYATVHTLVSTVRGKKRDEVTPVECIRAAFPGGSMTGAPKLRSMELLDSLEGGPRGVYSGTIGFFSINSSFDLNIVIRTLVIQKGVTSIGAGGAVVALSDPEDEYEEMLLKTRAPVRAVSELENVRNLSTWETKDGLAIPV